MGFLPKRRCPRLVVPPDFLLSYGNRLVALERCVLTTNLDRGLIGSHSTITAQTPELATMVPSDGFTYLFRQRGIGHII